MRAFVLALVALFVASAFAELAPLYRGKDAIEGEYIVVLKQELSLEDGAEYVESMTEKLGSVANNGLLRVYSVGSFRGFAAKITSDVLIDELRQDPEVAYIEQNMIMRASESCSQQTVNVPWGLDRVGERAINIDGKYRYTSIAGAGVTAYIVDTGILTTHVDFEGRAVWGLNTADKTDTDCNGHGTHVAGTVAGKTYGFAKKAELVAVKVLDCDGSGTNTGVIAGVEWVVKNATSSRKPSVANMSLGGGYSAALNEAVAAAVKAGVTFVVAAGNEDSDACDGSPSSEPLAITVGATEIADEDSKQVDARAYFSNKGSCVDVMAPGVMIPSAWIGSNTATLSISGTSMASPHVAGVAALFLGANPEATPDAVEKFIVSSSTSGEVDMECTGWLDYSCSYTPNKMLYFPCDS